MVAHCRRLAVTALFSSTFKTAVSRATQRSEALSDARQAIDQSSHVRLGAGRLLLLKCGT
jgi:hypothetical protein